MRKTTVALALLTAAALASCGGGDCDTPGNPPPPHPKFSAQVTFGDGFDDVGSYAVGAVLAQGGGKFTINGDNTATNPALTGKNWTELTAASFRLAAPCAAQTGLDGDPAQGYSVPVVNHAGCFGYAQGGARVSDPIGLFNAATGSPLGALTVPLVMQVANHLAAVGGKFAGDEIVFVNGGASDLRAVLNELRAKCDYAADDCFATEAPKAIAAMTAAANDLGYLIKHEILGKGATRVVVGNLPDPSSTPGGMAEQQNVRELASAMAEAFNAALKDCVDPFDQVLLVDLAALYRDEVANPGSFGLTDVTTAACGPNALGGLSLLCNSGNTLAGVDVSHFMFADGVHPTPFQGSLIARHVLEGITAKGWL
jgi:phospholipase/lecithinase/hemolysin